MNDNLNNIFHMINKEKVKSNSKKILILFVLVFLIFPNFALAQTNKTITKGCEIPQTTSSYKPIVINFELPGVTTEVNGQHQVKNLQCFIVGIYVYFSGVAGILATVMIMYGGVKYVISMGNPSRMGDAKDTIFSAVVGLVLVLGAYVLLNLINPNITTLKVPGLDLASVISAADECDNTATPLEAGKTLCGDKGTYEKIEEGKKIKSECVYKDCVNEPGAVCTQGTEADLEADVYECIVPRTACERVTDDNAVSDQVSCDPYSINGKGRCTWIDFNGWDDGCIWFPLLNCPNGSWSQVSCSVCAGDPNSVTYAIADDPKCEAGATDIVYKCDIPNDEGRSYGSYIDRREEDKFDTCKATICCQKMSQPSAKWTVGETISTDYNWDWNEENNAAGIEDF